MSSETFTPAVFPALQPPAPRADEERARLRGYAEGHAEGYRAGRAQAAEEAARAAAETARVEELRTQAVAHALGALGDAARRLAARVDELSQAAEVRIHAAAVELASLILAEELADRDSSARAALRRAFAAADPARPSAIRLHPDDLETLRAAGADTEGVPLRPDPGLTPGDAVVEVADGLVDARIGAALQRARDAVEEELR